MVTTVSREAGSGSTSNVLPVRLRTDGQRSIRRKEVIQPHLPIRLPCYDLAPIAHPTFAASLLKRLGQRLRVESTLIA